MTDTQITTEQGFPEEIQELSQKDFIVFAGTGCVQGSGIPPWVTLLERLQGLCEEDEIKKENITDLDEALYPNFAQKVYDYLLKNARESEYFETIKSVIHASNSRYTGQQIDIVRCSGKIITTNFDDTFEQAMTVIRGPENIQIQLLPYLDTMKLGEDKSISYLHGRTRERDVVLKTNDYKLFYPSVSLERYEGDTSDELESFLKHIWEKRTLVFIGFSFADKYILRFFLRLSENLKRKENAHRQWKEKYQKKTDQAQHYAFLPDVELLHKEKRNISNDKDLSSKENEELRIETERKIKRIDEQLKIARIKTIRYSEPRKYTEWLNKICELREKNKNIYGYK